MRKYFITIPLAAIAAISFNTTVAADETTIDSTITGCYNPDDLQEGEQPIDPPCETVETVPTTVPAISGPATITTVPTPDDCHLSAGGMIPEGEWVMKIEAEKLGYSRDLIPCGYPETSTTVVVEEKVEQVQPAVVNTAPAAVDTAFTLPSTGMKLNIAIAATITLMLGIALSTVSHRRIYS